MKKRNLWPLFFIGIFSFVFGMIIWTIKSATSVPVNNDESFLKSYSYVDENYNDMLNSNKNFLHKNEVYLIINGKKVPFSLGDIRFSQRVLEKISKNKDLLKVGKNSIELYVIDKSSKRKKDINISLNITKSLVNNSDIKLENKNFSEKKKVYKTTFYIKDISNWNITGRVVVDKVEAYLFIKTNAN